MRWRASDGEGRETVTVGPHERTVAGTAEIPADANAIELSLHGDRTVTNEYRP